MNQHLSKWDQEEFVLGQRTPAMIEHITSCPACRVEIAKLEYGISLFRQTAKEWSAQSLADRRGARAVPAAASSAGFRLWGWPMAQLAAAMMLLVLFLILPWARHDARKKAAAQHATAISDDALLQQVDDQLSVAVPASMESLTHLVATNGSQRSEASEARSRKHVQSN